MKLTPRLPIHGKYSPSSQFYEMRYLRFGNLSRITAIVFSFFEEMRRPQHKPKREALLQEITECKLLTQPSIQVLQIALDPQIAPEYLLAFWNTESFITMVTLAFAQFLNLDMQQESYAMGKIHQKFQLEVVQFETCASKGRCICQSKGTHEKTHAGRGIPSAGIGMRGKWLWGKYSERGVCCW